MRRSVSALVFALAVFAPTAASAAPSGSSSAAAEDLFQRGKALVTSGHYADACPLLAESYRLDPAGGTLQNLAVCLQLSGKWASAVARFEELRSLSKAATPPRKDRIRLADEHLAKIRANVAHAVIGVPADITASAAVEVDGVKYEQAAWAAGIAIDPGDHTLVVSAPGKIASKTTITVADTGTEQRFPVPALEDVAPPPPPPKPVEAPPPPPVAHGPRRIGYVVGGVGVAVAIGGGVFGVLAIAKSKAGDDACERAKSPSASPLDFDGNGDCFTGSPSQTTAANDKSRANLFATISDVAIPLGLIGVGIGAYLLLVRPKTETGRAVWLVPGPRGGSLGGRF